MNMEQLTIFTWKPRPESDLDCLMCVRYSLDGSGPTWRAQVGYVLPNGEARAAASQRCATSLILEGLEACFEPVQGGLM